MFARLRRLISRPPKPVPPPEPVMLPGVTVVEIVGKPGSQLKGWKLSVEQVQSAAVMEALAEGVTDPDKIREWKLNAREALKKTRGIVLHTGEPATFMVGDKTFTVEPR